MRRCGFLFDKLKFIYLFLLILKNPIINKMALTNKNTINMMN